MKKRMTCNRCSLGAVLLGSEHIRPLEGGDRSEEAGIL